MRTCAIVQSSYLPWRGYFDLIARADVFVFLDQVQYTRRSWRTRNFIKTKTGPLCLSVPVIARQHTRLKIHDVAIDFGNPWQRKHLRSIEQAYARAPFKGDVLSILAPIYRCPPSNLAELNRKLTVACWNLLSGDSPKTFLGDESFGISSSVAPTQRLIEICKCVDADRYISGPSASAYLDRELWKSSGIKLEFVDYDYLPYRQLNGGYFPHLSIVDVLMNLGGGSLREALRRSGEELLSAEGKR